MVPEQLRRERRLSTVLVTDNSSEFTNRAFGAWTLGGDVALAFVQPGDPYRNAFVETFN